MEYLTLAIYVLNVGATFGLAFFAYKIMGFDAPIQQRIQAILKVIMLVTAVVCGINFAASFIPPQECVSRPSCSSIEFVNSLKEYRYLFTLVLILAPLFFSIRTRMSTDAKPNVPHADKVNVVEFKRSK